MQPSELFRSSLISLVAFLVLAAYFLVVCFAGAHFLHNFNVGMLITFAIAAGALLLVTSLKWLSHKDLFSPLIAFPIAYVMWFGFASINLTGDPDPLPYGYFVLGLLFYLTGAWWAQDRPRQRVLSRLRPFESSWAPSMFWIVMGFMGLLAFGSYSYLILHMGIPALSSMAGKQRLQIVNYGPTQAVLFSSAWTVFVFLCIRLWSGEKNRTLRYLSYCGLLVIALMMLSLGSRGFLFVPVLTALIVRHYVRRRFTLSRLALTAVLLFIPLSLYGFVRDSLLSKGQIAIGHGGTLSSWLFPFYYAYMYIWQPVATFRDVTNLIPSQVPYQHGTLTFGALSTLLPGHHQMSDMFFKKILGSEFIGGGQPATLLGPFYGDFGPVGIAVGMLLFGVLMSRLYTWMRRDGTVFGVAIYAWAAQNALLSLFGSLFSYITVLWIPVLWCYLHFLIRVEGRSEATAMKYRLAHLHDGRSVPGEGGFGTV